MLKTLKAIIVSTILILLSTGPLRATASPILFSNDVLLSPDGGNCLFTSGCSVPTIGANKFSLSSESTIDSVSFFALNINNNPSQVTAVDWWILQDNGLLPGSVIASSNNAPYTFGSTLNGDNFTHTEYIVDIPDITLGTNNYWLAFQAISPNFDTYWSRGVDTLTSASSTDGGSSWFSGYAQRNDWAFTVYGATESSSPTELSSPSTSMLFILGLITIGFRFRSRTALK